MLAACGGGDGVVTVSNPVTQPSPITNGTVNDITLAPIDILGSVNGQAPVTSVPRTLSATGITAGQCYAVGSDTFVSCSSAAAIALNAKQDGMTEHAVSSLGSNSKPGFSYSVVGGYTKEECVKDNITGLIWEGKPTTGLRAASNTYTNLGDNRTGDTSAYVVSVNATALCGYTDWRLPTVDELQSIANYGIDSLAIDTNWFPNTGGWVYWSSTSYIDDTNQAWYVNFFSGHVGYAWDRRINSAVRLVR